MRTVNGRPTIIQSFELCNQDFCTSVEKKHAFAYTPESTAGRRNGSKARVGSAKGIFVHKELRWALMIWRPLTLFTLTLYTFHTRVQLEASVSG